MGMTPREGEYPTKALFEAGERPEDTVSPAKPKDAKLANIEVLVPLDEPDAKAVVEHSMLYGDSARP